MKWSQILNKETLDIGDSLFARAQKERSEGKAIYPPQNQIFSALNLTHPEDLKVCIVGQDPYHGTNQANGLAFSVSPGVTPPPSLINIFKELVSDTGANMPSNGDLTPWAKQGVLLLNTSLTVYPGQPASCVNWGWDKFVRDILTASLRLPQPVVYILWGAHARNTLSDCPLRPGYTLHHGAPDLDYIRINQLTKVAITSSHPSPYSAATDSRTAMPFLGSHVFTVTNAMLEAMGTTPVDWMLP